MSERRSTTVGTVPLSASTGYTVTTNAVNTNQLDFSGTEAQLAALYPITETGLQGSAWVYVAAGTPKIARVIGVSITTILLDRAMTGASSSTLEKVTGDLISYSLTNDGGADATINGVVLKDGESINREVQYPLESDWLDVVYLVATGTSVLILENK